VCNLQAVNISLLANGGGGSSMRTIPLGPPLFYIIIIEGGDLLNFNKLLTASFLHFGEEFLRPLMLLPPIL